MLSVFSIIQQASEISSTNARLSFLKSHSGNDLLKRVFEMAYDKVRFNFYITPAKLNQKLLNQACKEPLVSLSEMLEFLSSQINTRSITGHEARDAISKKLSQMSPEDHEVILLVLGRDLRVGANKKTVNKIWSGLITKPPYMRCGVYSEKTAKKIQFPAILQLKADGCFTYIHVNDDGVIFESRSGEILDLPILAKEFTKLPHGVYSGELLVRGATNRSIGNGLINSDNPPQDDIYTEMWSYMSHAEFAGLSTTKTPYKEMFNTLTEIVKSNKSGKLNLIETVIVNNPQEALKQTSIWMNAGYEGSILKDCDLTFKDGTSNKQLKLKVEIELEMRVTGFIEGKAGTVREKTFGSLAFSNDEGTIEGAVSGFSEEQLQEINANRDQYIGRVFSLKCNDITKSQSKETYALSHPRFLEFRNDKDETDTLARALELKQLALMLEA